MRTAEIYVFDKFAGNLVEDDYGTFTFQYDAAYLPVKLLLPEDSEDMALTLNGKKARIGRNDFIEFGKTIGLNGRQIARAVSRIIDALAASIESVLVESQLTDEFVDRFNKLVKRNIGMMRQRL